MAALGAKPVSTAAPAAKAGDAFGNLWSSASASAGIKKPAVGTTGPNLASLAKEKATAGIWDAVAQPKAGQGQVSAGGHAMNGQNGGGLDDLLG